MRFKKKSEIKIIKTKPLYAGNLIELKNAAVVFQYTVDSVNNFYRVYQESRTGSKGSTTHEEQDLLRAMLVFSCSGLDAVVKQLIKNSLEKVIEKDLSGVGARKEFQKFVERRIKKVTINNDEDKPLQIDVNFVSQVLTSLEPKKELLRSLQKSLTDDSLQSRDQLLRAAAHFAITKDEMLTDSEETKTAFDIRNDIIHEMDVDLEASSQGKKKRKMRGAPEMIKYTQNILNVGCSFINTVNQKINGTT